MCVSHFVFHRKYTHTYTHRALGVWKWRHHHGQPSTGERKIVWPPAPEEECAVLYYIYARQNERYTSVWLFFFFFFSFSSAFFSFSRSLLPRSVVCSQKGTRTICGGMSCDFIAFNKKQKTCGQSVLRGTPWHGMAWHCVR